MGLVGLATAHLGKSVSEYELVQLLENAARDTLNAIGAGAAAESALNAQRHKNLLESGAVVAAQILDVEGAALGAASTATQAPAALHRRLLERLPETRRAARSDDAQRQLAHDDPTPGMVAVTVTPGVKTIKPTLPAAANAMTPHAEAPLLTATVPPSTPMPPHAEAGSQRRLVLDDPASGVQTVKIELTLPAAAEAATLHAEAPLLTATVPPSTPMPPHAEAGSQRRLVLDDPASGMETVRELTLPAAAGATTPHAEAPLLAAIVPPSTPMPPRADAGSPTPFPPDETDGETDALKPGGAGEDTPLVPSNPKRARTSPAAALNEGGAGI